MKKLSMILLALFLVVCFTTGAVAEDRLKISGSYRARGWYKDNNNDFNDNNDADNLRYIDQRFRVGMKINIAEGITGNVRIDFGEAQWGQQTTGSRNWARPASSTNPDYDFQLDRTNVRIDKDYFTLVVGQQFMALGQSLIWDANQFGANLRIKLPVDVYLQYAKISEGGGLDDEESLGHEDTDFYGGQAVYSQKAWKAGVLAATINDNSATDNSPYVFGGFGNAAFGPLSLHGEFDIFGGSYTPTIDYKGAQIWAGGKYAIMDNLWVGLDGWWAQGTNDPTEHQITGLGGAQTVSFADLGPFKADVLPVHGIYNVFGGVSRDHAEFDPSGNSAGAIGGVLSAGYRIMEPLMAEASVLYIQPENSSATQLDSVQEFNVFLTYDWYENTELAVGYMWVGIDAASGIPDDPSNIVVGRLQIKF